jgi:hypothetical protein
MPDPIDNARIRGSIESIARQIPGFRGYLEKEYRRDSDALQREWLSDLLEKCKGNLNQSSRALADAGQIDLLPQFDRLRGQIDKLAARIRGAMRGYSGFFDLVQIDVEVLDNIYDFDSSMVDQIDDFAAEVDKLPAATADQETVSQAISQLLKGISDLEKIWDERDNILKGID